jgi:hypothetical protein
MSEIALDNRRFRPRMRAPMTPNYLNDGFTHAFAAPPRECVMTDC